MTLSPPLSLTNRRDAAASVLGLIAAPWFVRDARANGNVDRFALGVASGQPRPDSVVLWTRLMQGSGEGDLPDRVPVHWQVADDETFTKVAMQGEFTAESAWAHSVHAQPRGLASDRWYWYRFQALGQRSKPARTRTAPADDAKAAALRFAIASCQRYDAGHFAAWRHLAGLPLDAVIFLGDYIYEYGSPAHAIRAHEGGLTETLDQYRARYAQYKRDPLLQAAHAACPWWVVWDDHEVDNDYANDRDQRLDATFLRRRAWAYQAYWEHMPFAMAQRPRGADMRIHERFRWGDLATLHMLDDRQYRDHQSCPAPGFGGSRMVRRGECPAIDDPTRTLLGFEQEQWFADGLDTQRPWNLVAQQTLMARFAWRNAAREPVPPRSLPPEGAGPPWERPGGGATFWTDGWDGYPAARTRLLKAVAERKLRGTVVLGGDVHTHYVASLLRDFDQPDSDVVASEFVGTSITSPSQPQARLDAALTLNPHVTYGRGDRRGAIVFDVNAKTLRADLLGVDDVSKPDSAVSSLERFVVDAARPGPQKA